MTARRPRGSPSLRAPLRVPTFRNIVVADVLSDIGEIEERVQTLVRGEPIVKHPFDARRFPH
jgi:hypothetical protein